MLLLREVLRFTPETHSDFASCKKALESLEHVGTLINEARRQFESSNRLVFIAKNSNNASAAGGKKKINFFFIFFFLISYQLLFLSLWLIANWFTNLKKLWFEPAILSNLELCILLSLALFCSAMIRFAWLKLS